MRNGYKIHWSNRALKDLDNIIEYLKTEWGEATFQEFIRKREKRLPLISIRPTLYAPLHPGKTTRKSALVKRITIYYRIPHSKLFLVALFDNRQNPKKAPK
jgi:plasmid stabilization system protein ParE